MDGRIFRAIIDGAFFKVVDDASEWVADADLEKDSGALLSSLSAIAGACALREGIIDGLRHAEKEEHDEMKEAFMKMAQNPATLIVGDKS